MNYRRVVCLSTEAVETLYLLGAEDRIVGISGFTTRPARARREKPKVSGYEIHMGACTGPALARAAVELEDGRREGALSEDGQVLATHVHGLFDEPAACAALLAWAGLDRAVEVNYAALREASLDRLADAIAANAQLDRLFSEMR